MLEPLCSVQKYIFCSTKPRFLLQIVSSCNINYNTFSVAPSIFNQNEKKNVLFHWNNFTRFAQEIERKMLNLIQIRSAKNLPCYILVEYSWHKVLERCSTRVGSGLNHKFGLSWKGCEGQILELSIKIRKLRPYKVL